jgi:hypothetical protein
MKTACTETSKSLRNPNHATAQHLKRVANTFIELQQRRHVADYDNSKKWTRTEVLTDIELVSKAFASWDAISREPIADDFLLQLLIQR